MSVKSTARDSHSEEYDCAHCDGPRSKHSQWGSYCSRECYEAEQRAAKANELLNVLEHDHRYCHTCGRQLKEIEEPTESYSVVVGPCAHHDDWDNVTDVLIGYQYRTKHAETGEISLDIEDGRSAERPIVEDGVATGTVCTCGNTSHRHADETLRDRFPFTTAYYLHIAAEALRREEKHDVALNRDRLMSAVADRKSIREAIAEAVVL